METKLNNVTGRLCSAGWSTNSYQVLCRQLGFQGFLSLLVRTDYAGGSGPYWLNGINCLGNELNLFHCPRSKIYKQDTCNPSDTTVFCDRKKGWEGEGGKEGGGGNRNILKQ